MHLTTFIYVQNSSAQPQPPKLLDQFVAKMRAKHYSLRTEKSYIDWIKRYIWRFDKRHPKDMGAEQVKVFFNLFGGAAKRFC